MKRILVAMGLGLAMAALGAGVASADGGPHGAYDRTMDYAAGPAITDKCAGCHRPHAGQSMGKLLKKQTQYELCVTCHDGTVSKLDVLDGLKLSATQVRGPNGNGGTGGVANPSLNGGGFEFVNGKAATSKHNVRVSLSDPGQSKPWGYLTETGAKGSDLPDTPLTCTSCHNPHGSPNYRIIKEAVNSFTVSVLAYDPSVGVGPAGFTKQEGNTHGLEGAAADKYVKDYYGSAGLAPTGGSRLLMTQATATSMKPGDPAMNGVALLCGSCHTSYPSSGANTLQIGQGGTASVSAVTVTPAGANTPPAGTTSGTFSGPRNTGYKVKVAAVDGVGKVTWVQISTDNGATYGPARSIAPAAAFSLGDGFGLSLTIADAVGAVVNDTYSFTATTAQTNVYTNSGSAMTLAANPNKYRHKTEMPYTDWPSPKYNPITTTGKVPCNPETGPYKPTWAWNGIREGTAGTNVAAACGLATATDVYGSEFAATQTLPSLRLASNGTDTNAVVTCLTCHRAHGTATSMTGFALTKYVRVADGGTLPPGYAEVTATKPVRPTEAWKDTSGVWWTINQAAWTAGAPGAPWTVTDAWALQDPTLDAGNQLSPAQRVDAALGVTANGGTSTSMLLYTNNRGMCEGCHQW